MKRYIFSFLLVFCSCLAYAQADSIKVWNKYCTRADTPLLFIGSYNIIQICSKGLKPADIKVKSLDNTLKIGSPDIKGDTMSMMAMPYVTGDKKMRLVIENKKTRKIIKTVCFYGDNVPPPVARFGKITTADAPRKNLLEQTAMKVAFPNSLYGYPYHITKYTFKIKTPRLDFMRPVIGAQVPIDVLMEIKDAPDGTYMEFTDIKATCPECTMHTLDNLRIRIK